MFTTRYGHTERIVQRLENALLLQKLDVQVVRLGRDRMPGPEDLAGVADCVIVGGPLYRSRFSRQLGQFIDHYREVLAAMPNAFFSVSLTAAHDDDEKMVAVHDIMQRFFAEHHWHPCRIANFAGALLYTRYGPILRLIMRWISRSAGGGTNTHKDYVYTDWKQIPMFAQQIESMLELVEEQRP